MRITPLDARKQEFNKSMRGFDCDEVRAFLSTLADEYETVLIDNRQIRERVLEQEEKINDYQHMEQTLRDTLMTAERVMQETRENATREGDVIIQEAQLKAKGILEECRLRTEELRREIRGLRKEKETYLARFRSLAEAQIQFVDNHQSDFEDLDKRLVDIVDSVVADTTRPVEAPEKPVQRAIPAPIPVAVETTVAPTPAPAPVAGEQDIWRDYNPGAAAATPFEETPAVAVEDIPVTVPANDADVAGNIADIVSESLSEAEEPTDTEFRPPVEPLDIDVISNGQDEKQDAEEPVHHT